MKIQFKDKKKPVTLIAMSDIAFLLLIFLIVIVNVKSENEVTVPEFRYSVKVYPEDMFLITVEENGNIFIEGSPATAEQLLQNINNAYYNGKESIGIYADKETDYEYVSNALKIIQKSLISNIVLITEKPENGL